MLGLDRHSLEPLADALGRDARADHVATEQDQQEFLATIATGEVTGAQLAGQCLGDRLQHQITSGVSVGVVHLLEVIDVHHQQRQPGSVSLKLSESAQFASSGAPTQAPFWA
jgi:hypothetical protein